MKHLDKIKRLREKKLTMTREKLSRFGTQDEDDYGAVIPPPRFEFHFPCTDGRGFFYGVEAWSRNFRALMEAHPVTLDPDDALAGRWMFMMSRMRRDYRISLAPFPFDYSFLHEEQKLYDITSGIGKDAHFAPDYRIGLQLGWGGLKHKVMKSLEAHTSDNEATALLRAEFDAIEGIQNWIQRTAEADSGERRKINEHLISEPPRNLREACQWIAWFNMASRTYNRDGAGGQLDEILRPYYEHDIASGVIDDDDALWFLASLLINDPHYYQLGGPDRNDNDQTSTLSFLILEAAHLLKSSCNLTIRVHDKMNEALFKRGLEILIEDKLGYPRFSGDRALVAGFMKNGFSAEQARERIALGCNWMCLPGREYTLNDVVKINFVKIFEVAFKEFEKNAWVDGIGELERIFFDHLVKAVDCVKRGLDFHLEYQHRNEPELLLNLLCYGPVEKGRDASHGGVEFYNMALDGAGLATVADSFGALEQRIEQEKQLSWKQVAEALSNDFKDPAIHALLKSSGKFGNGASPADRWARKIATEFTDIVKRSPTPGGRNVIPGLFSWADTLRFGQTVGATPDGRKAGEAISHGANPNPGFRRDGALTAIAAAVAAVQPGYGNTAPLQLEIDLETELSGNEHLIIISSLIKSHFAMGGTLININIINSEKILAAEKNPEKYPDLLVRVTGFSAYFTSLSPEFRKLIVNRIIIKGKNHAEIHHQP